MNKEKYRARLGEVLPVLSVENDLLVSVYGDLTAAFRIVPPRIFSLSEDGYDGMQRTWANVLAALPEHFTLHRQDFFFAPPFDPGIRPPGRYLDECSDRHFFGRRCLESESYIYLSLRPAENELRGTAFSSLLNRRAVPKSLLSEHAGEELEKSAERIASILEAGRIAVERMDSLSVVGDRTQAGLLDRYLSLSQSGGPSADMTFPGEGMLLGEKHVGCVEIGNASSYPASLQSSVRDSAFSLPVSFLASLGPLLNCPHILNVHVSVTDPAREKEEMERRLRHMTSLSLRSRPNAVAAAEIGAFLNRLSSQSIRPVRVHADVAVWGRDAKEKAGYITSAVSALSRLGFRPSVPSAVTPVLFFASFPGGESGLPVSHTALLGEDQAACLLCSESIDRSVRTCSGVRLADRLTGAPVYVDLSDAPLRAGITSNRNKFVFGPSGTGKSFFMNHLLRSCWEEGADITVVDCGHSYRPLVRYVQENTDGRDGRYVSWDDESPLSFNLFRTPDRRYGLEQRESIACILFALWKRRNEPVTRVEQVVVDNSIARYSDYIRENGKIVPSMDSFLDFFENVFMESACQGNARFGEFDFSSFLDVMRPFRSGGKYGTLLNSDSITTLSSSRFTVFDIDSIKESEMLFTVVTLLVMQSFMTKLKNSPEVRKVIVIEEAWRAISNSSMAEYMRYLYRTVRKHYGEAVTVTQDIDDLVSSPVVRQTIINNSSCRIITDAARYSARFAELQELLGIGKTDEDLIRSLNTALDSARRYREVWIGLGSLPGTVYGVEVSEEEYEMYTTEPTDRI